MQALAEFNPDYFPASGCERFLAIVAAVRLNAKSCAFRTYFVAQVWPRSCAGG